MDSRLLLLGDWLVVPGGHQQLRHLRLLGSAPKQGPRNFYGRLGQLIDEMVQLGSGHVAKVPNTSRGRCCDPIAAE